MGKCVAVICFLIFIGAALLAGVAFCAPWWAQYNMLGITTSYGLFQTCTRFTEDGDWTCDQYGVDDWSSKQCATVAMMCLAMTANVGILIVCCLSVCGTLSIKAAAGASGGAGCFQLIAISVYAADIAGGGWDWEDYEAVIDVFGWAYWIAAVSTIAHFGNCIITFILDCLAKC